jgi:hypothetical protein
MFSRVTSVSTRNAEGPRDCGSGVFTAEQDNRAGGEGSRDAITIDVETSLEVLMEVIDVKVQPRDYFPQLPTD